MMNFNLISLIYRMHPYVALEYDLFNCQNTEQEIYDTGTDQLTKLNEFVQSKLENMADNKKIMKQLGNINLFL